ncbi:hypothetical protein AAFF_G00401100 [Aldrovandia affinis]|uniref:Interleukin-1 n=1 Tax=Aldrovandia affinis TaxID=143900 RepID=A0AAD7SEW4_9TELE|nr:hypothetical protein AAFF_G00401100 [Aldrovandia affinis]
MNRTRILAKQKLEDPKIMCDASFDLALALDSPCTPDDMEFGADCHHAVKGGAGSAGQCCDHSGLEVQVSRTPDMRQVANLIIALERMKHSQKIMSTECSDQDLLSIMMESVVEERVMLKVQNLTCSKGSTFMRNQRCRDMVHSVCTTEQRKLVHSPDDSTLHAVAFQAMTLLDREFRKRIVRLSLSTYHTFSQLGDRGQPIALGIANSNLYLSCAAIKSDTPILQLEEVDSKKKLEHINTEGDMARFLFFKQGEGFSSSVFESVKFSGWVISTAHEYDAPVQMCAKGSADRITTFIVRPSDSFDKD